MQEDNFDSNDFDFNDPNLKFTKLTISKEEMNYLSDKFEMRNHGEIFAWSIRLLYDLAKAEEKDWYLSLIKGDINSETQVLDINKDYNFTAFLLEWLCPTFQSYHRINIDTYGINTLSLAAKNSLEDRPLTTLGSWSSGEMIISCQ